MKYDNSGFDIYSDPTAPSTVSSHASLTLDFVQLAKLNKYLYIMIKIYIYIVYTLYSMYLNMPCKTKKVSFPES